MSVPSQSNETSATPVPETLQGENIDETQKTIKSSTLDPQSLPVRNSSLLKTRTQLDSSSKELSTSKDIAGNVTQLAHTDDSKVVSDIPPTPPPKNDIPRSMSSRKPKPVAISRSNSPPKKKGFIESLLDGLLSCCTPSSSHDDEDGPGRTQPRRRGKGSVEMDSLRKENDHPTTSTIGVLVTDEDTAPPVPKKRESASEQFEETKPSVTIASDVITEKETNGQPRVVTPLLHPVGEDDDEELATVSTDDDQRERELRHSMQIQAPFPPTADEVQSDALLVSPTPEISLQNTSEPEESDVEEVPRPLNQIIDEPQPRGPFLGPVPESKKGRKCLVLDLDECLIHSTFADSKAYDFSIALNLDREYGLSYIYVGKRPHLDEFLDEMGRLFEIVIFTASLQRYADPVVDIIDRNRVIDHRLFRDSCTRTWDPIQRVFLPNVKNISLLGRDLKKCIIIDNNPQCYQWHPEHAVPISSWFEDHLDVELLTMIPLLKDLASDDIEDVRDVLSQSFQHT